jgi:hypothetical protein
MTKAQMQSAMDRLYRTLSKNASEVVKLHRKLNAAVEQIVRLKARKSHDRNPYDLSNRP